MKKQFSLPLVIVAGGIAAYILRLLQNRTGFEADTGLPIPGNPAGLALVVLFLLLAVLLLILTRRLPREAAPGPAFPSGFFTEDARLLTVLVLGVFLIALSGAVDLLTGLGLFQSITAPALGAYEEAIPSVSTAAVSAGFSPKVYILAGVLSLLSSAGLLLCAAACRRRDGTKSRTVSGTWLLVPVVALVVRLVLTYRIVSINPSLEEYYVEVLALVFSTLAFYRLSSFAFRAGRTDLFALFAGAAVILSAAALTDNGLSSTLLYAGNALVLLGFLLLRLTARPVPSAAGDD